MSHIDYYFSTISPFSYLAGNRLEVIAAKHGASIAYKPMDVIALFARTGGVAPAERHPARQAYRLQELRRQSKKNKLALNRSHSIFRPMRRLLLMLSLLHKVTAVVIWGRWCGLCLPLAGQKTKTLLRIV